MASSRGGWPDKNMSNLSDNKPDNKQTSKPSGSATNQRLPKSEMFGPRMSSVLMGEQKTKSRQDVKLFHPCDVLQRGPGSKQSSNPHQHPESKQKSSPADNTNKNVSTRTPRPGTPAFFKP